MIRGSSEDADGLLEEIVRSRTHGENASDDHPRTEAILRSELQQSRPRSTSEQAVNWYGQRWAAKTYWHSSTKKRIEDLVAGLGPPDKHGAVSITRRAVFERRGDPVDMFLAAMAWGFGTTGYGSWRTATMINPAGRDGTAAVNAAVHAYRTAWEAGGSEAVASEWSKGEGKVHGLGPAFASKVAYFACYDHQAGTGPLIADLNTAWAVWALGGIWDSRYDAGKYADYVAWCEGWAAKLGGRSDDIERVLFNLGPTVRAFYQDLKASEKA